MSFFGLETDTDAIQKEKERFLRKGLEEEKLAVFNWGESDYDGLGDALHEGGDELNDETFGDSGPVGKFSMLSFSRPSYSECSRQGLRFFKGRIASRITSYCK